ncbi:uncharacterized protein [Chelonus insularis]|uniref:uncharacterized protein n=1 Tax=Chelonus insularis TaxID=460826 RepID=UPI001588AA90|nr:uncharacterized protein LOC118070846 [Chelonus insularis]
MACINAGFGHDPLIRFFECMDFPPPHPRTLKSTENEMGPGFVMVATESFKKAIEEEKALTIVELSLPEYTADAFTTGCGMCERGHDQSDHECCSNWSGSLKAMEAAMGVRFMLENDLFKEARVQVGTFIGDDDACTYSAVQRQASHNILKLSDANHVRKKFGSDLYELNSTYKELNGPVIPHLKKCFNYALDQNRHNSGDARKALLNIVNHVYGEHKNCGDWCKAKDNPHKRITRIAHGGSSQPDESFNHMVAMKYPKNRHYAETNSYKYRTLAAVCLKNLGASYMNEVFSAVGLKAGDNMKKYLSRRNTLRENRALIQNSVRYKRKRCQNKLKKTRKTYCQEKKEGVSYQSGNFNIPEEVDDGDNYTAESPMVMVDLETTSFYASADILQIAAICNNHHFVKYMFPLQRIDDKASEVNGFTIIEGNLCQNNVVVATTPPVTVAKEFLKFLKACGPRAFLVAACIWFYRFHSFNTSILQELLKLFKVDRVRLISNVVTLKDIIKKLINSKNKKLLVQSLQPLKDSGISKYIVNKIAIASITYGKLKEIYRDSSDKGIRLCLSKSIATAKGEMKPVVTSSKKIINEITVILSNETHSIDVESDAHTTEVESPLDNLQEEDLQEEECERDSKSESQIRCECVNYDYDSNTDYDSDN